MEEREAYYAVHARLVTVLRGSAGDEPVPGCPSWTTRDAVAHLAGLCEDWVDGRLDGYASERWTAAQVSRFAGAPLEEVFRRWAHALGRFAGLPDDPVMGSPSRWAFGDAVVHEADIRGAVGAAHVPAGAVALALKGQIARWRETLADAEVSTLLLRCPDLREWWVGQHDDPGAVIVTAPAHDVFRALAGRRSAAQVMAWSWDGDPEPYVDAGLPYPFAFADAAIVE